MAETRRRRTSGGKGYPRRGEIYLTALDPALGHEIKKTRPALVIQNNVSIQYSQTTIVAAITSTINKPPYPNEALIQPSWTSGLLVTSTVRLDQLRTVDRRRLLNRLGSADLDTMRQVDLAIKASLGQIEMQTAQTQKNQAALTLAHELDDPFLYGQVFYNRGVIQANLGDLPGARQSFTDAYEASVDTGDSCETVKCLSSLAVVCHELHAYDAALAFGAKVVSLAKQLGSDLIEANLLHNLGNTYYVLGETTTAQSCYKRSFALAHALSADATAALTCAELAGLHIVHGTLLLPHVGLIEHLRLANKAAISANQSR